MAQLRAFTTIHKGGTTHDFKRRVVAEVGRRAVQRTRSPGVIMSEVIKHSHWVFRWLATRVAPFGHSNCSRLDIGGSSPPHLLILQDSAIPELVAGEGLLIPWRKPAAGSSPACRAISFSITFVWHRTNRWI